ncbi:MAG: bifunctional riboflavin kinase/FAD synthetase [Alphaproteobacteria bacterium]|nr:bifunctional riboflavin kinase/FAD synthetase [Alphaproteobacteria bacterium]
MTIDSVSLFPSSVARGGVFALGNFDGVHRGHRAVLDAAIERARSLHVPARVLTFEPHPRALFWLDHAPFRLTPQAAKERLLKECGIDEVVVLPFSLDVAQMPPQDFAVRVLHETLGARHVVAGYDFTFGYKRGGDMARLGAWLKPYDVGVTDIAAQGAPDGEVFSSTRIRAHLQQGEVEQAAAMLGHVWAIEGVVTQGAQRGRTIGVPTANIALGDYLRPRFGVYAVRAGRAGEEMSYKGVANIGVRPTVGGVGENLEAHLFDFDGDIYGQVWQFALTRFIRPEMKFDGIDALKAQILRDIDAAKQA